ncbi:O-antigen ligase family protein [Pararhizobium sp. BT-229]|uniref:O-antigen ligase family protein n=1 Tax=Pararhizobium sp. BT-229 TaxID=2986923 RepID=UPI0021F77A74|nr:O-antigen ligase family protein [Pararhizobium sp. BT-229]MCV9965916.1 O-antigen ligase family protein [Pararhizobium sp. BT-229]
MRKTTIVKIAYIVFLTYALQLRWIDIDNQAYARLYPGGEYGGLILGAPWRFILLAMMVPFFMDLLNGAKLIPVVIWIICGFASASFFWSIAPLRTAGGIVDLALFIGYTLISVRILGPKAVLKLLWGFGVAVVILSSVLAVMGDQHALMSATHAGKWRGLFNHKNVFAPFVATILLITLYGSQILEIGRLFRWVVAALCIVCLAFAQSSSSNVAAIAAIIIMQFASFPIESKRLRVVAYAALMGAVTITSVLAVSALDLVVEGIGRDLTLTGRTAIWEGALPYTFTAPFGYGFRTSGGEEIILAIRAYSGWAIANSVHNVYLNMALDIGWFATLLFAIWLLSTMVVIDTGANFPIARLLSGICALHFTVGITEVIGGVYSSIHLLGIFWGVVSLRALKRTNSADGLSNIKIANEAA